MFLLPNSNLTDNATHAESALFVEKNLNLLKNEINEKYLVDFNPSYVEYKKVFSLYEEENKFVSYLDFNDNNGYLILGDNLELLDISLDLQLSYLKDNLEISYSKDYGFLYYENNKWVPFNENYLLEQKERFKKFDSLSKDTKFDPSTITHIKRNAIHFLVKDNYYGGYDSTETGHIIGKKYGPGYIVDEYKYVYKRYGKQYREYDSYNLKNPWSFTKQGVFSIYKNSGSFLEGNCLLTSLYLTIKYLHETNQIKFKDVFVDANHSSTGIAQWQSVFDDVYFIPEKDEIKLFRDLNNQGWTPNSIKENNLIENGKVYSRVKVPFLYLQIRNVAKMFGYKYQSEWYTPIFIESITKNVINKYSINSKRYLSRHTQLGVSLSFNLFFVKPLLNNKPVMWNFYDSQFGDPHSVVAVGYKTFAKSFKIFRLTKYYDFVNLVKINDNHHEYRTWFDISYYTPNFLRVINFDLSLGLTLRIKN